MEPRSKRRKIFRSPNQEFPFVKMERFKAKLIHKYIESKSCRILYLLVYQLCSGEEWDADHILGPSQEQILSVLVDPHRHQPLKSHPQPSQPHAQPKNQGKKKFL